WHWTYSSASWRRWRSCCSSSPPPTPTAGVGAPNGHADRRSGADHASHKPVRHEFRCAARILATLTEQRLKKTAPPGPGNVANVGTVKQDPSTATSAANDWGSGHLRKHRRNSLGTRAL